jgi:urate oxidase
MSLRFGSARSNTGAAVTVAGGVDELSLILTGGSGFTGFRRDRLTVQSDATDRPLCGTLWARWHWLAGYVPTLAESRAVAADLAGAFAGRSTNAIQELVTAASTDLLGCTPALVQVRARLAALPLVPLPLELVGDVSSDAVAHEVHDSPLGVTEVLVRRPPA